MGHFRPLVYFGTYTVQGSKGIYSARFDSATGRISEPRLAAPAVNPSFLTTHPTAPYLYAVSEVKDYHGSGNGAVMVFEIDWHTGGLTLVQEISSGGRGPCHLAMDPSGTNLLVANYGEGTVAVIPSAADGRLKATSSVWKHSGSGVHQNRQNAPHPHSVTVSHDGRFVWVPDLGLDQVRIYQLDADTGRLAPHDPPFVNVRPGAGPRRAAFHLRGRCLYVINELDSTIAAFVWEEPGRRREIQTVSTLPANFQGTNAAAEIQVHPTGRFLYGSNRGHDSLVVFDIDPATGALAARRHFPSLGRTPRHFGMDPRGQFLLVGNQDSNEAVVFQIDQKTGALFPAGERVEIPSPTCILFVPA